MMNLSAALSALQANQIAMDVVGNNIANANTPSYHRQDARFETRDSIEMSGHRFGQGVSISHISRSFDEATEEAILRNLSEMNAIETQLGSVQRVEALLTPGQGTVLDEIESFFDQLESLTAHPDNASSRTIVVRSAQRIASSINRLSREISSLTQDIDQDIDRVIREIEQISVDIISLDVEIKSARARGQSPNDLLDQRQQLVQDMAVLIDVEVSEQRNNGTDIEFTEDSYRLAGGFITFSTLPVELKTFQDENGNLLMQRAGKTREFPVTSGRLGGLLAARNGVANKYLDDLAEFASGLISQLDTVHATGVGLQDGFTTLVGQRGITDSTMSLADVETFSPIKAGSLFVTVIDPAGNKTLHEIEIDPNAQSADDLASAISAIPHVQATIDPIGGRLNIVAEPDYQFNFTGAVPTMIDDSSISGTSRPTFTGLHEGYENKELSFEFIGSGDIGGKDQDLQVEIRDKNGELVNRLDIGGGYAAGDELMVSAGVFISFSSGTIVSGDSFTTDLVSKPDTTGVLAAFGVNSLFGGTELGDFSVNESIVGNPNLLATRHFGSPLDTTNALRMLAVRDDPFLVSGTQTAHEFFTDIIASAGTDTAEFALVQESLSATAESLAARQQGISGVDPNEEIVRMLQYQRAFQSVARYIVSVEETLDELFNILR
jgi:flagellar hook-associated protein FlgK